MNIKLEAEDRKFLLSMPNVGIGEDIEERIKGLQEERRLNGTNMEVITNGGGIYEVERLGKLTYDPDAPVNSH